MNTRCLCSHVRDWHSGYGGEWHSRYGGSSCSVTSCGCKRFRSAAGHVMERYKPAFDALAAYDSKPDLDHARALAAVEVERIKAEMEDEPLKDGPPTLNSDAGDARKLCTCTETVDVDTGYGKLRCDLRHPHPGLNHHDPQHRLWWAVDEIELQGASKPATNLERGGDAASELGKGPRVWTMGDPEPDGVTNVRDNQGDVWTRDALGVWWTEETAPAAWSYIAKKWAPLTEVTRGAA